MGLFLNGLEAGGGSGGGDGTLIDSVETVNASGVATIDILLNKLVKIDTSGGAIDMTFPNFTADEDRKGGTIVREGANLARLLCPGGYNFLYPGGTASPFSLATNGDSVGFIYVHATLTIHLF